MSAISLRLPNSLHKHMKEVAKHDGVSVNQFISVAISEKVSALFAQDYLEQRAKHASRARFEKALSRIPHSEPDAFDKL
ncbi:MAG: CopG family transcriptional regulator [Candidatus Raymondbacteria bacterium RifOxyA12_full_50_37]|uniref:CopG family transcriptional regulator n=1 Tax=Candidatus Raymondbacteria bacterium RIFOXYD12_FULL_49_13 TaxID=1817890 RepID=A0A1F7F3Q7_UNCRA|nr:MAG: CopG family transcriptional regulator [Candidatus Raymondbacteria bacterium RifOxyA12_full_50_37]OGJ90783.1 MAG: CopG family transcriptional regulator [Candidatus Raymondbacteria bacterium RIFOXYA2_FULL_49_16]OGJ91662.1 MAG: CopG family transcriptional regulator [Candidatus Raymondbacteria bacterium RifOxyB12_full_50_8]OGJ97350.1 MAG: CopG family transcriptional regulator [Candidatus Raymondbacteria bacterium RIFOXYC2_FULL_50_21]OGK01271.1 MAG: CopG family transcriptional regulator [Can